MRRSLSYNAVYSVAYQLLNVVFPLISASYAARVLSPEGIGEVAYAQNIVSYFTMLASAGIVSYGTREIARCRDSQRRTNTLFTELLLFNAIVTVMVLACYGLFVWRSVNENSVLYIVVGLELVFNFINIDWFYQGTEEYNYIAVRSLIVKLLSMAALFLFVKSREEYVSYAMIHCIGIGCNYCFNIIHARRSVRLNIRGLNLSRHIVPIMWLTLSSVTAGLYSKVDITMLGALASKEAVAYYTNGHKVISLVLALVTSVSAVFLPRLSYAYANDRSRFTEYLSVGLKIILLLAFPACVGILAVAENLIVVMLGEAFLPCADVLRILSVLTIVKGVGDLLCYQAIISSGNERMLIISRVIAGVANVVLNALLIPHYGYNGAAAASVISEVLVNGILLCYSLSAFSISVTPRYWRSILLSTFVMGSAAVGVQHAIGGGLLSLCITVLVGIAVYGIMLIITKNEFSAKIIKLIK